MVKLVTNLRLILKLVTNLRLILKIYERKSGKEIKLKTEKQVEEVNTISTIYTSDVFQL